FALLFTDDPHSAEQIGQDVLRTGDEPVEFSGRNIFLSLSVGIASGRDVTSAQSAIDAAERALADAKRSGGARTILYSPAMQAQTDDPIALEADLRRALDANEFEVFYQPIVDLDDAAVAGFEAL